MTFTELSALEKMLFSLLTLSTLNRPALLTLEPKSATMYSAIQKAVTDKFITQHRLTSKEPHGKFTFKYYTITMEGIRCLVNRLGDKVPWLANIDTSSGNIIIRGGEHKPERIERMLRIANTAAMMQGIGAQVPFFFLTGEQDEKNSDSDSGSPTLHKIVTMAAGAHNEPVSLADDNRPLYFYSAPQIKNAIGGDKSPDANFGRYTGILEGPNKSVLLYFEPPGGMAWPKKLVAREYSAFKNYSNKNSVYNSVKYADVSAGVIVQNAKRFGELYYGKKPDKKDTLGTWFNRFYAIPATHEGMCMLTKIMKGDDNYYSALVTRAVNSGVFTLDGKGYSIFSMKYMNGVNIFIGSLLDIIRLRQLEGLVKNRPNLDFCILCFAWQVEYYKKVLPDAFYLPFEDNWF